MAIFNEKGEAIEPVSIDEADNSFTADDIDISGEKEQEVTDPVSDTDTTDADGELTAPDMADDESADSEVADAEGVESLPQSKAENRRQAAARRQREAEEQKTGAQDEVIKSMNILNPVTGKPFESFKEYTDAQTAAKNSKIRSQLRERGIDTEAIDKLIDEHPAVAEAKRITEAAKAAEDAAKAEKDRLAFNELLDDVRSVFPEIKEAADLFKWSEYKKFSLLVSGGISPKEAAQTLAGDKRATAARQAAFDTIASKSHLVNPKKSSKGGDYKITDAQYASYLAVFPDATREQAAAAYKKYGY